MEDLDGFRQFLRMHTSWVYEVTYDAYMIGQILAAEEKLVNSGNTVPENLGREKQRHIARIHSIIQRVKRET